MVAWIFASLWHAIVGLVLLTGFFIGAIAVIAQSLAESTKHDQRTCQCWDCQDRRVRSYDKAKGRLNAEYTAREKRAINDEIWLDTTELYQGIRVVIKDDIWLVSGIREMPDGTRFVHLHSTSGIKTMIGIKNVNKKIWKRAPWV